MIVSAFAVKQDKNLKGHLFIFQFLLGRVPVFARRLFTAEGDLSLVKQLSCVMIQLNNILDKAR